MQLNAAEVDLVLKKRANRAFIDAHLIPIFQRAIDEQRPLSGADKLAFTVMVTRVARAHGALANGFDDLLQDAPIMEVRGRLETILEQKRAV